MIPSVQDVEAPTVPRLRQLQERWTHPLLPRPTESDGEPPWPRIDQSGSRATLADAFGSLRTAILLEADASAARSLLLTSAQPGEGKTTVCINLALSLARLGVRVLLVDADIRRPSVHRALGLSASAGLVDALQTGASWRSRVRPNVSPGVDLLPAGIPPSTPSELLSSPAMRLVVAEAQTLYDFVLIDSPALLPSVADTRILARLVDGVVVVVRSGTTPREILGRVLRQVPNLTGVVLNGVEQRHFPAYYRADVPTLGDVGTST
jgi:polysaccharide biosynthesis transport protein